MYKFLLISNMYYPHVVGGAELTVQALAEELVGRGFDVVVISLSVTSTDTVDDVNGIRVYRLAVANLYHPYGERKELLAKRALWHALDVFNPVMARKVGRVLDQERPDHVSTHNITGFSVSVWSAVKARGIPLSHMLHDYYLLCPNTKMNTGAKNCREPCLTCRAYSAPKLVASRQPDIVLGVSRFILERHRRAGYFPNARSGVLYGGRPLPSVMTAQRPPRGPVLRIGFIGRLDPLKGIETLLKAVARLPEGGWTLLVAGRAHPAAYLDELKKRYPLPQVTYLGFVDSTDFYNSIDIVVVPSEWQEPLGSVAFEPMGFGLPVLAARVGGLPEVLGDSGCGWLFEPGDVDDLTARLTALLGGWPDEEGMRARAFARRAFFVPERQATDFLEYMSVAKGAS